MRRWRMRRVWRVRMMKIGIGYRHELADWLDTCPPGVECLELTAEHFYVNQHRLGKVVAWANNMRAVGQQIDPGHSLFVHGLGLSLGTPGPLDRRRLEEFAEVAIAASAEWISEHVAFTRTAETDLGHLNPVLPTRESVRIMAEHAREVTERCGKPLLLEN